VSLIALPGVFDFYMVRLSLPKEEEMKIKRVFKMAGLLITSVLLMGACAPSPSSPPVLTLNINDDVCTLEGSQTTLKGDFSIKLIINQQKLSEVGYALLSLEKGKTIDDLKAWKSENQPPWSTLIDGVHETTNGTHTYTYDPTKFSQNAAYQGGPLYLMCFRKISDTGTLLLIGGPFGPFEIKQ
jgi:hypothetical protein